MRTPVPSPVVQATRYSRINNVQGLPSGTGSANTLYIPTSSRSWLLRPHPPLMDIPVSFDRCARATFVVYFRLSGCRRSPELTVVCLNWETASRHGERWIDHHRLRHRLFVERQGWDVPTYRGMEYDQFDTPAAQYLLWLDERGRTRGAVRLLPTVRPYMLQTLWPELINGTPPATDAVWEATRFGCDRTLDANRRRIAVTELLCAMQEFGMRRNIDRYLIVMSLPLLKRVVVNAGCEVTVLGPERILGKRPAAASYLTVSREVLAEMHRRAPFTRVLSD
ncbi:acyl-homoserine-lactone synthase [Woeseia oceani]|nr:acyl-homoserine-lactone synthase [Woeseia oceani]